MTSVVPPHPKIYHITHLDNLAPILQAERIWSDAESRRQNLPCEVVGMSEIKRRRLEELEVTCHPGTKVGEYVPFYFCPRSIMLFILHRGNHPEITYRGGQSPIVHLEADLHRVIQAADLNQRRWAFSTSNAGARLTDFYGTIDKLSEIHWRAVAAHDFRDAAVKEGKQAEFLVYKSFPWPLVDKIGVCDDLALRKVRSVLASNPAARAPSVRIEPNWYF